MGPGHHVLGHHCRSRVQLLKAASAAVNGGYAVTPHLAKALQDENGSRIQTYDWPRGEQILSAETSATMREVLESVVAKGTGHKAYIPGYRIGGKTATSEKLPRKCGKYIASFLAFAPADAPRVMALVLIDEPQGVYYGGTVAGPVMQELLTDILPYLGVEKQAAAEDEKLPQVQTVQMPDLVGTDVKSARKELEGLGLTVEVRGTGETVTAQFPPAGQTIRKTTTVLLYS